MSANEDERTYRSYMLALTIVALTLAWGIYLARAGRAASRAKARQQAQPAAAQGGQQPAKSANRRQPAAGREARRAPRPARKAAALTARRPARQPAGARAREAFAAESERRWRKRFPMRVRARGPQRRIFEMLYPPDADRRKVVFPAADRMRTELRGRGFERIRARVGRRVVWEKKL